METTLSTEEETIGDRIRRHRLEKGWSMDRLAREAGLAKNTVAEAETRAGRKPWFQTLEPLAKALDVPVLYLQTGNMPVKEENLDAYTPHLFGRAKGIHDPKLLSNLHDYVHMLQRLENVQTEVSLDSVSAEDFAKAKGINNPTHLAHFAETFQMLLDIERRDAQPDSKDSPAPVPEA